MLVVGDREQENDEVSVRRHRGGDQGAAATQEFVERLRDQVESRSVG
jgi:threonyl-tRNA synthetase